MHATDLISKLYKLFLRFFLSIILYFFFVCVSTVLLRPMSLGGQRSQKKFFHSNLKYAQMVMDTPIGAAKPSNSSRRTGRATVKRYHRVESQKTPKKEKNKKQKLEKVKINFQATTLNVSVSRRQKIETSQKNKGNKRRAQIEL